MFLKDSKCIIPLLWQCLIFLPYLQSWCCFTLVSFVSLFQWVPCFKLGGSLFSGGGASEETSLASLSSQPGRHVSHRRVGSATALSDCGVVIHHCVFCTCSFHHDKVMIILMYCTKLMPNKHRQTFAKGRHIVWTGSCIGKLGKVRWVG